MFLPYIARFLLLLGGWTLVGGVPDIHKAVVIVGPHTSNWDGYWGLVYKVAIGLNVTFFAKQSLFWFPLSLLLKALGGIPLHRGRARSAVDQAVAAFNNNERFLFALAPEGTRRKTRGWKTGFYRIAETAGVPVVCGFFDYANKRVGLGPIVTLTGDKQADLVIFRSFYTTIEGRWPEKTSPVIFASAKQLK